MKYEAFGPAALSLTAAWILSSRAGASGWGRKLVGAVDALTLLLSVFLWSSADPDPLPVFLVACAAAAVLFAALGPEQEAESLFRLHLGASLVMVAVCTREISWSVAATLLGGVLVGKTMERLPGLLLASLAALAGLGLVAGNAAPGLGVVLLVAGLSTFWLLASREVLRSSASGLTTGMAASFTLLVAVSSVNLQLGSPLAGSAPEGAVTALAFGALGLGALGVLGSTRITTFLTALALARGGLLLLALLGGAQARAPFLLTLAATGVSLLLAAAALEKVAALDEIGNLSSIPRRLTLALGVLSAAALPPFAGFVALFPLASALSRRGYAISLVASAILLFLLGLGSMRVVARAWEIERERVVASGVGLAALALAVAAALAFSIFPAPLLEVARIAARAID